MPKSFLSKFVNIVFSMIIFLLWVMDSILGIFGGLLVWTGLYFLFRKKKKQDYKSESAFKRDVVFSPVQGKVESVSHNISHCYFGKNLTEVRITMNPWDEMGIHMPMTSEVQDFNFKDGNSFFRYKSGPRQEQNKEMLDSIALTLRDVQGRNVGLQFLKCYVGSWPEISLMPGDRGKQQANFGYFPFGGTVLLYMPKKYEILIAEKDKVIAGETLIAGSSVQE
ncbi:MAG: phosphatidylserine decarboxylase [Bacteriovoracaceae bacterium]|nr:phosphatidylserine decarboxylase [Bacteriovoracaceae bacterium]